jgi:RNA polymerase sigma-70 factor (ECF subfamily)
MPAAEAQLEALFRREAGNISAWLARLLGPARLALIEDAVQDAFGAALAQWPFEGTPQKPAAWLAIAARNKALDRIRSEARLDSLDPADEAAAWRLGFSNPEDTGKADDTLALMFVACHPALNAAEQAMLTLQTVCGFNPREIARAYLSTPEAVTQRLPALLNAIYLLFNGGYTAAEGEALMRRELCAESLRLVSLLCEHPGTASGETHALAALVCFHHARAAARTAEEGALVLLEEQDRTRWDYALIQQGFAHLKCAMSSATLTALHLEAGIASVHVSAARFADTDWEALARYYGALLELKPTVVVRVNAALVSAYAHGPAVGLAQLDELSGNASLSDYAPYHAARGELLKRLGRPAEAADALRRALTCPINGAERAHLSAELTAVAMSPAASAGLN